MADLKQNRIRVFRGVSRILMVASPIIGVGFLVTGQLSLTNFGLSLAAFSAGAGLWGLAWIMSKYDL